MAASKSIAVPYKIIPNDSQTIHNINDVVKAEEIDLVVVGMPLSMSGESNERVEKTEEFVKLLKSNLKIAVETVDERLSSKLYENQSVHSEIDKHSATAILDTYIQQND